MQKVFETINIDEFYDSVKDKIYKSIPNSLMQKIKLETYTEINKVIEIYNDLNIEDIRQRILFLNLPYYKLVYDIDKQSICYKYGIRGVEFIIYNNEYEHKEHISRYKLGWGNLDKESYIKYLNLHKNRFSLLVDSSFLNIKYCDLYDFIFENFNLNKYKMVSSQELNQDELDGLIYYLYKCVTIEFLVDIGKYTQLCKDINFKLYCVEENSFYKEYILAEELEELEKFIIKSSRASKHKQY